MFYIKDLGKDMLPGLLDLAGSAMSDRDWHLAQGIAEKKYNDWPHRESRAIAHFYKNAHLFDMFFLCLALDDGAIHQVEYLKSVTQDLSTRLSLPERLTLAEFIRAAIIKPTFKFQHLVSGLSIIEGLTSSHRYQMVRLTERHKDGFIEVLAIHTETGSSRQYLISIHFLEGARNPPLMLATALGQLMKGCSGNIRPHEDHVLVPVIWANHRTLKKIEAMYKTKSMPPELPVPFAFAVIPHEHDLMEYRFQPILSLFALANGTNDLSSHLNS